MDRDPLDRDPLGQRPPWTETPLGQRHFPWTETPFNRDPWTKTLPPDRHHSLQTETLPPRQRPSWTETPLDRDPPGQRPPWTETPLDRDPLKETPSEKRTPLGRDPPDNPPDRDPRLDRDLPGHLTCGAPCRNFVTSGNNRLTPPREILFMHNPEMYLPPQKVSGYT